MDKIDFDKTDEQMEHFWVKTKLNEILKTREGEYKVYIQQRRGFIISGTGSTEENSFKLEARFLPDIKRLKFTLYQWTWRPKEWNKIPVKKDNTVLYGLPHYIDNVGPENVDTEVIKYFDEFKRNVEENKING